LLGLSRFLLRHKLAVVVFWLVILVAGVVASAGLGSRLSNQVSLPGDAGYQANQQILGLYGNGGPGYPEVAVVTLPPGDTGVSAAGRRALGRAFGAVAATRGLRVADYASTGDPRFLTADPRVSFGLVFGPYQGDSTPSLAPQITSAMRPALPAGSAVTVTGMTELQSGSQAKQGSGVLSLTLVAGVAALAVLVFVFGSALALVPLLMAAVAIPGSFLAVFGLTEITSVFSIVQYLVALIGLGVAIDYSLLLVTRWREELAAGHDGGEAVGRAMVTAGRSVAFSGLTVALGLLTLIVIPVPLVQSIGYGSMLIPAVSVAVTLTLLPVLLAAAGRRLDWPRRRRRGRASRAWTAWAALVVRRRWAAALVALAILGALGAAATGIRVGEPSAAALAAANSPAAQALRSLEQAGVPPGVLDPIEVLVPAAAGPAAVARRLAALPGVRAAVAPAGPAWRRHGTALVSVQPAAQPSTPAGAATIASVRHAVAATPGAGVGGLGALLIDENHAFYGSLPLLIAVLAAVTLLLLARAFGSLLLPVKAVALNLISIAASYGVIVLVWQDGHGSQAIWGLPALGAITNYVPLVAFAFLYGLSMDYEVFIVTRIREERDRTGSTSQGVVDGLGRTGRLVTGAALCLFLALAALTATPETAVAVLATALAAGILLDATIVRGLLVPALVALLGRANWWLPGPAARLLRVPAPLPPRELATPRPSAPAQTPSHKRHRTRG
jgi:RND superfamily putative drug exporter